MVVVLGEDVRVAGFSLAGATVRVAQTPDAVLREMGSLPDDVSVVVLTAEAARVLREASYDLGSSSERLHVVMPL